MSGRRRHRSQNLSRRRNRWSIGLCRRCYGVWAVISSSNGTGYHPERLSSDWSANAHARMIDAPVQEGVEEGPRACQGKPSRCR
jgi:hypothetical protein